MNDKGKLNSLLNAGHFGKSGNGPTTADPLQETRIEITLDEVRAYDHNPRQTENDRFEEIKDSIRTTGRLKSTLHITRRPGDEQYIISAGGNTRLQALRELYAETGDDRFHRFNAVFQPWESEVRVLTDHLIENDLRADLTFIDQALALRKLREELGREAGEKLSLRRFETALKKLGYAKSYSLLSKMDYAVDVLWPLIPRSLSAGMGKHQVVQFRRLHKAYQDVWTNHTSGAPGDDPRFVQLFEESLRALDETGFDLDSFQETMNYRLADMLRLPAAHYVATGVDNVLHGLRNDDFKLPSERGGDPRISLVAVPPPRQPAAPRMPQARSGAPATAESGGPANPLPGVAPEAPAGRQSEIFDDDGAQDGDRQSSPDAWNAPPLQDLDALRRQAYQAAQRFAAAIDADLRHCVIPYAEGLGYLVDLPGRSFNTKNPDNADEDRYRLITCNTAWWMLVTLSEVTLIGPDRAKNYPEGFVYGKWMQEDPKKIYEYVGILEFHLFGKIAQNPALFNALDELRDLMHVGQQIRRHADDPELGWSLWPTIFAKPDQ